jgi:DNA-binding SARP family transcriptional activator
VGSIEIRLLGTLELRIGEATVPVRSRKQRAVLAVLALDVGKTVSTGRLIEALWGESPPPAARNSLEAHVSRLRKLLGEHGCAAEALRTQSPGYVLEAGTDLAQFECMRADASALIAAGNTAKLPKSSTLLWRCGEVSRSPISPASRSRN